MTCIKDWGYKKFLQYIKPLSKKGLICIGRVFALLGGFYSIIEIEQNVFKSEFFLNLFRENTICIFTVMTIIAVILSGEKTEVSAHLGKKDYSITLKLGDLLRTKNSAIVIPTNSTFDTTMYGEFISEKSIQGKFQNKFYHNNVEELDKLLQTSLDSKYHDNYEELNDRINTKSRRYPIGSVAKITINKTHYYFLAMSDVSAKGKPENVTMHTITEALVGLWNYLSEDGHTESVTVPVIGTGRGRLQDGNLESVVQETIFSFISAAQEDFIAKGLTVCIYPPTLREANVSWEDLCNYLKLNCCFAQENNKHKDFATVSGKPTN